MSDDFNKLPFRQAQGIASISSENDCPLPKPAEGNQPKNLVGHCGYVAIIGRPNVGKSTLLNHLLGQKLSITSRKPQTTRHRLLGIKTVSNDQIIYIDTPGLQQDELTAMNRYLNRAATNSLEGIDVILWVVEALQWTEPDNYVLNLLEQTTTPIVIAVNKVDKVKDKNLLLPYLQTIVNKIKTQAMFPISASHGQNLAELEKAVTALLPISTFLFPEDQITDRSERFLSAELIREKLVRRLGAELPYRTTVQIEHFSSDKKLIHISAIIWVERPGQKAIVIGKQGSMLKNMGEAARQDLEILLGKQVFLQLWVKVKQGWCDDERNLQQLGYGDH